MRSIVSALAFAFVVTACGPIKKVGEAAKSELIDCAKENISEAIVEGGPTLVAAVVEVVTRGDYGWRDLLGSLGNAAGEKALACAVRAANAGLSAGHLSAPAGAVRASEYLTERGWRFAQ